MVKKVKTAVALGFEPGDQAPKIIATGKGHLAEKIIEEAKKSKVPHASRFKTGRNPFKT